MKRSRKITPFLKTIFVVSLITTVTVSEAQSILKQLEVSESGANELYNNGAFQSALNIYLEIFSRREGSKEITLRIARTYFKLHQYEYSAEWYKKAKVANGLSDNDLLQYAEALTAVNNYREAILQFKEYITSNPGDELIQNKIWRLNNIKFLYDDSTQYSVNKLDLNSPHSEMSAVPFGTGFVFISNRSNFSAIKRVDPGTNAGFYKLYFIGYKGKAKERGEEPSLKRMPKGLQGRFHNGQCYFFDKDSQVAYTKSSEIPGKNGKHTLQLFFARVQRNKWVTVNHYSYNSTDYSIMDPWINQEGTLLYFTSDMQGGEGGKDLYKSEKVNGAWTAPQNLGKLINSRYDEQSAFLSHDSVFYFSSNGHAGLGGFDIFKVNGSNGTAEVVNMGFPLNSHADDFAFTLNKEGYRGHLTSNRSGAQDDIYQVEIDQQVYPLLISGVIKLKEFSWKENAELEVLPNASLFLIDHARNLTIGEVRSDLSGKFSLNIPYFSIYKIRVVQSDGSEALVSLEIPRQKKRDFYHEIVVVKNAFKNQGQ